MNDTDKNIIRVIDRLVFNRLSGKMMANTGKNIILCYEGAGTEYEVSKTNVIHTCELAVCDDMQLLFYDPGVGTGDWEYEKSMQGVADEITGSGLQKNVEDGYRFLMNTYQPGDRIFLFGYSRGAFTACSLAGMLSRCGLLRPNMDNLVEYASKLYNKNDDSAKGFKAIFARPCPVHFIGVWDTVGSLALDASDKFHDYMLNPEIKNAYQALALDEKRSMFPPHLWDESNIPEQTVEQVWFAGVHADIGGWHDERGLSDIALRWMLEKAEQCGMKLKAEKFAEIKGDPLDKQHESYKDYWIHMGMHEREIPSGSKVHKSVKERMDNSDYQPVKPLPEDVEWVD